MRVVTIVVVLIIHVVFFLLFTAQRGPAQRAGQEEASSIAFLLPPDDDDTTDAGAQLSPKTAQPTRPKRAASAAAKSPGTIVRPEPPSDGITVPASPDWRREMQIAANNAIEAEERKRHQPSPLAPHDFSGVKPGSTDDSKPQFGWSHAATHRVEAIPTGGLLININDRCVVAWVILPMIGCRIGKIPVRGDLLEHMKDAPALGAPELP